MASACINSIGLSPEKLLDCSPATYSSYSWFNPRLPKKRISSPVSDLPDKSDFENQVKEITDLVEETDLNEFDGFEFRLDDPAMMLPADELFSDGKLVPLKFSVVRQEAATSTVISGVASPDTPYSHRRRVDSFAVDPYLVSPRAPRCSSRWRELLGFGKNQNNNNNHIAKTTSLPSTNGTSRSIRQLLHRSSKSQDSVNLPLLKDLDNESVSISSRPSLSSSSSGHDLDDLPRLSLDSDKPNNKFHLNTTRPKTRMVKTRETRVTTRSSRPTARRTADSTATTTADRGVLTIDSPRMNSSGKIVFHSLERSSSSPSSLNGGPRFKNRGMERSYSANVRVTPVLNVPVCSLKSGGMFGFPIFTTQHKREGSNSSNNGGQNRSQRFISK